MSAYGESSAHGFGEISEHCGIAVFLWPGSHLPHGLSSRPENLSEEQRGRTMLYNTLVCSASFITGYPVLAVHGRAFQAVPLILWSV